MIDNIMSRQLCIESDVSGSILKRITDSLSYGQCIIEICGVHLDKDLFSEAEPFIKQTEENNDFCDIIFKYDNDVAEKIFESIEICECEVVILYFCFEGEISVEYFKNRPISNSPQSLAVIDGICPLVCTWVTENNELWFNYNSEHYNKKMLREITKNM